MVGNPFSGGVFTPFLCTRIPFTIRVVQSNSTAALFDRDLVGWWQKVKVREMGNVLRTDVEWGTYRSCPRSFRKVGDNTLKFVLVLCRCWVFLWVRYVGACLCVTRYCMSLRGLWAQKSLDCGVDVSSSSNEGLQVGLAVDEAHSVELVQLGLEPNLRGLGLRGEREWNVKPKQEAAASHQRFSLNNHHVC